MKENGIRYDRSKMSSFVHESTHDIRKNMCREEEKERIKLEDFIDGDSKRGRGRERECVHLLWEMAQEIGLEEVVELVVVVMVVGREEVEVMLELEQLRLDAAKEEAVLKAEHQLLVSLPHRLC
jgi:hypothetical protein